MQAEVQELKDDLIKRFDKLCSIHDQPRVFINDYFYENRNNLDYDAEAAIINIERWDSGKIAPADTAASIDLKRAELIFFLKGVEQTLISKLPDKSEAPKSSDVYASIKQKIDQFSTSFGQVDINQLENAYRQIVLEIIDERNKHEKKLLGNMTVFYKPSIIDTKLGPLFCVLNDYLSNDEMACLNSLRLASSWRTDTVNRITDLKEAQDIVISKETKVNITRPLVVTRHQLLLKSLAEFIFENQFAGGNLVYLGEVTNFSDLDCLKKCSVRRPIWNGVRMGYDYLSRLGAHEFGEESNLFENLELLGRRLSIAGNLFKKLGPQLSVFSKKIRELDLSSNRLESVDEDLLKSFDSLTRLIMLRSCHPDTRFSLSFLTSMSMLRVLRITLPDLPINFEAFQFTSRLTNLELESAASIDANKKRPALTQKDMENLSALIELEHLTLSHFQLASIDKKMLRGFKKLVSLNLSNNKIACIHQDAFKHCSTRLRQINLAYNELVELQPFLFSHQKRLQLLSIESNYLNKLRLKCFRGLSLLKELQLGSNQIKQLPIGVLKNLKSLEKLHLERNKLVNIKLGLLRDMVKLGFLNLKENPIISIASNSFVGLTHLNHLDLSNCNLRSISNSMFKGLKRLQTLSLDGNRIEKMGVHDGKKIPIFADILPPFFDNQIFRKKLFNGLPILKTLSLARNRLTKFDLNCLANLKLLETLDLSHNSIGELNSSIQERTLKNLCSINLQNNQLKSIHPGAFSESIELTKINLSHNQLEEMDERFFAPFENLTSVDVRSNKLTIIESEDKQEHSTNLRLIDFSRNNKSKLQGHSSNVKCSISVVNEFGISLSYCVFSAMVIRLEICNSSVKRIVDFMTDEDNLKSIKLARSLSFTKCSLASLDRLKIGETFANLEELDLSGNKIVAIEEHWFTNLDRLTNISLANNLLETLNNPKLLEKLSKLICIDMSGNQLRHINQRLFSRLNELTSIDLSNNQLAEIDVGLFRCLGRLEKINLSNNNTSRLDLMRLVKYCPKLTKLNLAFNQLDDQSINQEAISEAYHLEELVLAGNRLRSMRFVQQLVNLRHLDLSYNLIESVEEGGVNFLGRLFSLIHLDLGGNKFKSFKSSALDHFNRRLHFLNL